MDVAKAVGVVAKYGGSITEYEGAHKVPGPIVPLIAIPAYEKDFKPAMLVSAIRELCIDIGIPENLTIAINNASGSHGEKTREYISVVSGLLMLDCHNHIQQIHKGQVYKIETDQPHMYINRGTEKASGICFFLDYTNIR